MAFVFALPCISVHWSLVDSGSSLQKLLVWEFFTEPLRAVLTALNDERP